VSESTNRRPTAAVAILGIAGAVMLIAGLGGGFAAKAAAEDAATGNSYLNAISLDNGTGLLADAGTDYTGFYIGLVVAALGIVALIAAAVVFGLSRSRS
jgi:hypothetical protein